MKVFGAWSLLKSKSLAILPVLLCIRHHPHFPVGRISARLGKYQGVLANAGCCKVLLHRKHTFIYIEDSELTCTLQMLIMTLSSFLVVIYGRVHYKTDFLSQIISDIKDMAALVSTVASGFPKQPCAEREQPSAPPFGGHLLGRHPPLGAWLSSL